MVITLLALARFLHFGSALLLFSFSWFSFRILQTTPSTLLTTRRNSLLILWLLQGLSGVLWFFLASEQMSETWFDPQNLWIVLTQTHFGQLWLGRAVLGITLGLFLFFLDKKNWVNHAVFFISLLLLGSLAWSGHAVSGLTQRNLRLFVDLAHLLSAAVWPIGLVPFLLFLWNKQSLSVGDIAIVTRFSRYSLLAVAVIFFSGATSGFFLVGTWSSLFSTTYGQLLLVKIVLFLLMIGLGAYHRFCLLPRLFNQENALTRFRYTLIVETCLAVGVLLVVAFLGLYPPPRCLYCS